jgi:hypothetical protein
MPPYFEIGFWIPPVAAGIAVVNAAKLGAGRLDVVRTDRIGRTGAHQIAWAVRSGTFVLALTYLTHESEPRDETQAANWER